MPCASAWTATAAAPVAGVSGVQDFAPQIIVTEHDSLAIGYYRQDSSCGATNRCLTLHVAISNDEGLTWTDTPTIIESGDICDLPVHCFEDSAGTRFLGEYRESVADLLHSHLLFSDPDSIENARLFTRFFSARYGY